MKIALENKAPKDRRSFFFQIFSPITYVSCVITYYCWLSHQKLAYMVYFKGFKLPEHRFSYSTFKLSLGLIGFLTLARVFSKLRSLFWAVVLRLLLAPA
jgi:hypothetical protein